MKEAQGIRKVTDGGRALRAHIDDLGISVPTWCERHDIDRIMVQRAMNGDRERFSVDFALRVEAATKGAVKVAMWSTDTLAVAGSKRRNGKRKAA